jgi:hypothetical protein
VEKTTVSVLQDILNSEKRVEDAENRYMALVGKIRACHETLERLRIGPDRLVFFDLDEALMTIFMLAEEGARALMLRRAQQ